MELNEFQKACERTMSKTLEKEYILDHALFGMCSELGEINGIYQKYFQGHDVNQEHLKREVGYLLWFICEFCTVNGWELDDVATMNIEKLLKRYPNGFEPERSVNRLEVDV